MCVIQNLRVGLCGSATVLSLKLVTVRVLLCSEALGASSSPAVEVQVV